MPYNIKYYTIIKCILFIYVLYQVIYKPLTETLSSSTGAGGFGTVGNVKCMSFELGLLHPAIDRLMIEKPCPVAGSS